MRGRLRADVRYMEREPLWAREAAGSHPLMRERSLSALFAGLIAGAAIVGGFVCAVVGVLMFGSAMITAPVYWLLIPAAIPLSLAIATGRNPLWGVLGGMMAAGTAYLTIGVYVIAQLACFILTWMGDCG